MPSPTEQIDASVASLLALLAQKSTKSVVGWCTAFNLQSANDLTGPRKLHSPARQISFLLGLLLSTPEPVDEQQLTESEWEDIQNLLNDTFSAYQLLYYPDSPLDDARDKEWLRARDVSLPAFMYYVGSDIMATVEQLDSRIMRYLVPFDDEFVTRSGISFSGAVSICRWLLQQLNQAVSALGLVADAERAARLALLEQADTEKWTLPQLQQAAQAPEYRPLMEALLAGMEGLGVVHLDQLKAAFPDTGEAFWRAFAIKRGDGPSLAYPTEQTTFDLHPLILRDGVSAYCPTPNGLLTALLTAGEQYLTTSSNADRYYRHRDNALELEGHELFRRYFGEEAHIVAGAYETSDGHFEHDLVVIAKDRCLIVEAKASPPVEPFRDPDKAFTRLSRAFRSDKGIQSAFEQASRIARRLRDGEVVELFDRSGASVIRLDPSTLRGVYTVCLTRDDHGPLATNLNLLLAKRETEPYPWVVNCFDLTAICEVREYWNHDPQFLFDYLDERLPLHGKAFTTDELDMFGFRLRHGTLNWIRDADADMFVVGPEYSTIFDKVTQARIHGDPSIILEPTAPTITDLRKSLAAGKLVTVAPSQAAKTPPRNRPCPCGSGLKYKKCCGA